MIENPQPAWLPLFLLVLPGIAFSAFAINQAIFPHGERPLCTVPAIGIVLALLPTHALALAFGSLTLGLAAAWTVIGVAGYVWIYQHWREFRFTLAIEHPGWARRLGIAALATLPIVLPTILLNFYDEANFNGHHAMIAHLQNGTYPPRYLYEPTLPLRYHYAFDLAGAIVTGLLRVRLDHAVDLLTLALWPCMFLLLWRVGEYVGGRRAGLYVALAVCFSGGWPALAWAGAACGFCTVNGIRINPPFIQHFFQHPWGIGVPLFCLAVLQRAALPRLTNRALGVAVLICTLALLSLSEAVLFVSAVVAMALTEAWCFVRFRDRCAAEVFLAISASVVIAKLIGGFFVSGPFPPTGGIFGTAFYLREFSGSDAVLGQAQWNVASFGAVLILGIVGLLRSKRDKMFLLILAALTLVITNLLEYKHTWDIAKFGVVSFIALAIGAGIVLSDLRAWATTNRIRTMIFDLFVVAVVAQGAPYPFIMLWAYDPGPRPPPSNQTISQMIRPYFSLAYPVDPDNAAAVSFLRTHLLPSEIVYRSVPKVEPYAIWGGLPTQISMYPADTGGDDAYGLGQGKFSVRTNLDRISHNWLKRLSAEHIAWLATDDDDAAINALLASPEVQAGVVLVAQYGDLRVFHLQ
jgi:hypothetical protein